MKGRSIIGALARVMKERSVSMEVKRGLRNSILLLTLTYESEMWTWNRSQQSRVCCGNELPERGMCCDEMGW